MKVNSMENYQGKKTRKVIDWVLLAIIGGFALVIVIRGGIALSKVIYNFLSLYWHFVIMGILALLFLKRWFKKKEVVVSPKLQPNLY